MTGGVERVGAEAFDGTKLRRPGVVVVGFLADWCPFCRVYVPELEEFARRLPVPVLLGDVTSEESPLWELFRIDIVPTVLVFDNGREVDRRDGVAGAGLGPVDRAAIEAAVRARSSGRAAGAASPDGPTAASSRKVRDS